jgi:aryl-alcohol dehydrogenase-like predicted oxidoreductase
MEIARVGLGAWAIGGGGYRYGWGPQDDAASIATILHAVELGINWIDTAAVYGFGHAEEIVGQAVRRVSGPATPFIFSKCGVRWDPANPMAEPRRDLQPASIRNELDASLSRLGAERIDLYQCHWPDDTGTPVEESWRQMLQFVDDGRAQAVGVSNFDVGLLERAEAVAHVDSIQPPFSMIRRSAGADVIPWARAHETGVIVYSPMQSGLLTGRWSRERVSALAQDDWRRQDPEFQPPRLERNLELAGALRPIADRHGATVGEVAIAWTLAWPGVTGAIVGARSPEQVDGWIGAGGLRLNDGDLDEIASAIESSGAGEGPARPPRSADRTS